MKNRMINTKFWSDGWIINLDPLERYLFLYLLTNEHTNICGIYELPLRIIARESGIDDDMILKMLKKLSPKIKLVDGWIYIKNFLKHQRASGNVPLGIENGLKEVPRDILAKIKAFEDTLPCVTQHSPQLELESESKLEPIGVEKSTRREISFKKEDYNLIIEKYQFLKGIQLKGNEFKPIQQTIKSMFLSGRSKEDIVACMEFLANNPKECWQNWTINTIFKQLPLFLAGKL